MCTCRGDTEGTHKIMEENMHAEKRKKVRHGEEVHTKKCARIRRNRVVEFTIGASGLLILKFLKFKNSLYPVLYHLNSPDPSSHTS